MWFDRDSALSYFHHAILGRISQFFGGGRVFCAALDRPGPELLEDAFHDPFATGALEGFGHYFAVANVRTAPQQGDR